MKLSISMILILFSVATYADTASEINAAIVANFKHTQSEDAAAALNDLHSESPAYLSTKQALQQVFSTYDLKYELLNYQFVGEDSEYAYAKIKQRTSKVSGPAFDNNELEMLMIFKQEHGIWKIWTQVNLSLSFL
ncbi:hypothetical protein [Marinomonas balearica]|uniref:Ketosteroid isomerase-like protein n=1 Tax=Marinomonas balearica TaxID=491947 RepID=A0A4R6MBI2_9GAMM|nr:hypothetical protein [Marinomonas balearica]TDO98961.1 hypothetical protein DFP79_1385 [Marinomonas balearica]